MKMKSFLVFRRREAAGPILGLACLLCASASAELLKNPDFESEFPVSDPTAGWALVYVNSAPGDFSIAGHTTYASRTAGGRGAHLRSNTSPGNYHAYFTQVVTNLAEGVSYTLTIQRMRVQDANYATATPPKLGAYMSAISGSTSNYIAGDSSINGPYSLVITAAASRQIEVQLHMYSGINAVDASDDFKSSKCSAWFDDCSLVLTP
jgi:hypothetical protein